MDEKEILQRQVDALEKLLNIKEAIIQEQEAKLDKLHRELHAEKLAHQPPYSPSWQPYQPIWQPQPFIPPSPLINQCTDGNSHEWNSLMGPCKKCGALLTDSLITTSQINTDV